MKGGRWPPRSFSPISFFSFLGAQNSFANPGVNDIFPQQGMGSTLYSEHWAVYDPLGFSSQEKAHNHATHGQTFKNRPLPLMNFMALPSPVAERLSWTKQGPAWNPNEVQRVGTREDESKWLIIIAPSLGQWAMCFLQCAIWCNVKCVMYKMSNYLRHCIMCCLYTTMARWYFGYSRKTLSHGKIIYLRLFFLCSFRKKTFHFPAFGNITLGTLKMTRKSQI